MDVFARNRAAQEALPSELLACSSTLGWGLLLARIYRDPPRVEQFVTAPSSDLLVVAVLSGRYSIEVRAGARWRRAEYRRGSVGATAPSNVSVLRWRASLPDVAMDSLHVHLARELLEETASALPGGGLVKRRIEELPDALSMDDPLVTAGAFALASGLQDGAPALYADSVAQMLATHLVYRAGRDVAASAADSGGRGAMLESAALRKVTSYMHEHLDRDISLDDLAAQVNISKFHFLRMFAGATGLTPHRYLRQLRLQHAAHLLRTGDRTVFQVALACGYRSAGQFARTFRREYGSTPSEFRRRFARA